MLAALVLLGLPWLSSCSAVAQPNDRPNLASDEEVVLVQVKASVREPRPKGLEGGTLREALRKALEEPPRAQRLREAVQQDTRNITHRTSNKELGEAKLHKRHHASQPGVQKGPAKVQKAVDKAVHGLLHGLSTLKHKLESRLECKKKHTEDLYRPIKQVLAEHPGVDGNCYFHWYADYLGTPTSHAELFKETVLQYSRNAGRGKQVTLHLTNGEDVTTHLDGNWGLYPYDDAMCYMMGWLKGQRLDAHVMDLLDDEKWRKVSAAECARLPQMVKGGLDENNTRLTIGHMADDNDRICHASSCLTEPRGAPCKKATLKDYVYHLYPKCLLGEGLTGASGQVAWCFARACVTKGKVIKHGKQCWPEGMPF